MILSRRSRMSSTLLLEAASISIKSRNIPEFTERQWSHLLHGRMDKSDAIQFKAFANILATVVFPVPRGPEKRYACTVLLAITAFLIVSTTDI